MRRTGVKALFALIAFPKKCATAVFSNCSHSMALIRCHIFHYRRNDRHNVQKARRQIEMSGSSKMKKQRMIKNMIAEAAKTDVVMPWTRGTRRREWIAKRNNLNAPLKSRQG
ncbi:MAG TPA: hypothetical protein DD729_07720 [Rhodobacteraceae bacterium]|jgi:hypothetical protein|nr:hypothetical protein [Paracoccaceae bacterium]